MTAYEKLQDEVAYGFRKAHGRCGVYINRPISPIGVIMKVLKLFYDANSIEDNRTLIVFKSITNYNIFKDNIDNYLWNKSVSLVTEKFFNNIKNLQYKLIITVGVYNNKIIEYIAKSDNYKFYLNIFDNRDIKDKNIYANKSILNILRCTTVSTEAIIEESIHSPVNETLIGVSLKDTNFDLYQHYSYYITNSMKIFQNLDTLDRCRRGDRIMNRSAIAVCSIVADNNGWSEEIDTSTEFGKQVDDLYNPNALFDRANNTYSIMKKRKDLVTDATEKLPYLIDIINSNKDSKIVIVSVRGDYAFEVSKYLKSNGINCGNYHDMIPETVQTDSNGNPVLVKSGSNKGQPRIIGAIGQSTLAMKAFNADDINVLSIKAASDSKLMIDCDILIFTSPLAGSVYDIRRRFQNVFFRTNPLKVYTLYCNDTTENVKVDKYESTPIYEIIRDDENIFIAD